MRRLRPRSVGCQLVAATRRLLQRPIHDVAAGSGKRCGGAASIQSLWVRPSPMPLGFGASRLLSVRWAGAYSGDGPRRGQSGSVRFLEMRLVGKPATRVRIRLAPGFAYQTRHLDHRSSTVRPRLSPARCVRCGSTGERHLQHVARPPRVRGAGPRTGPSEKARRAGDFRIDAHARNSSGMRHPCQNGQ